MATSESPVTSEHLEGLTPVGQLQPEEIEELAKSSVVQELPANECLFSLGETDDWTLYLLDGAVLLATDDGATETIVGGSVAAEMPLAPQQPRSVTATAVGPITVLRVVTSVLDGILLPSGSSRYAVDEIKADDEHVENQLLYHLFEDYVNDKLEVPILPDISLRIREAVQNPDIDIAGVEKIVTTDPVVAARLIQVANSPAYRGAVSIDNCRDAIARFGLTTTQEIVTALAVKGLFRSGSPLLKERMNELWRHSTYVASLSFVLAKQVSGFNPNRAQLAGLVHDIGALSVLSRAAQYKELLSDPSQLDLTVSKLRGQFGAMILRKWEFPDDMVTVALEAEDWDRDSGPEPDYCDLILVAQLHGFAGTPQLEKYPSIDTLPAFEKLALGEVNEDMSLKVLDDAKELIDELQGALAG